MKVAISTLASVLNESVAEIKFKRRNIKDGAPINRRMLCTTASKILNSKEGRTILGYTPPKSALAFNPISKNLLIVWDIMKKDYRAVPMDNVELISTLPIEDFWDYYKQKLTKMTASDIDSFYNV
jgi:hypothetical protein